MFDQMPGHAVAQSNWYMKLTIRPSESEIRWAKEETAWDEFEKNTGVRSFWVVIAA